VAEMKAGSRGAENHPPLGSRRGPSVVSRPIRS
jgi:hypothetical protein